MEHTPKNLLIRAVKTGKEKDSAPVMEMMDAFHIKTTLEKLLYPADEAQQKGE